ncbi:MAG: HEAT repeat domain-containing protein [Mariniblastus sp.]|nr:HEAT repeat domain-containing protein [Mariniblastus sp.]
MTAASLAHHMVTDWLQQNEFNYAHFPEVVDLATVMTGLGLLRSQIPLVSTSPPFWDSTLWTTFPRPFLDGQGMAYAMAQAAWCRGDKTPEWTAQLPNEVRRPMLKSIKHLFSSDDSFFHPSTPVSSFEHSQSEWLQQASNPSTSRQIIAIRHLQFHEHPDSPQVVLIGDKLRSPERSVQLHAIAATERMKVRNDQVVDELRMLLNHRDDQVRSKAICALARFAALDETAIDVAARMLDDQHRFVAFAGLVALGSLDTLPAHVMPAANRGLVRSLQTCDYELVGLFSAGFHRWLDDPKGHYQGLLQEKNREYLEIALEVLENVQHELVSLNE